MFGGRYSWEITIWNEIGGFQYLCNIYIYILTQPMANLLTFGGYIFIKKYGLIFYFMLRNGWVSIYIYTCHKCFKYFAMFFSIESPSIVLRLFAIRSLRYPQRPERLVWQGFPGFPCLVGFRIPGLIWGWCRGFVRKRCRVLSQLGFLLGQKTKHEKLQSTFFGRFFSRAGIFVATLSQCDTWSCFLGGWFVGIFASYYWRCITIIWQGFLWGAGDSPSLRLPNLP